MPHTILARGKPIKVLLDPIEVVLPLLADEQTPNRTKHKALRFIRQWTLAVEELLEDEPLAPAP